MKFQARGGLLNQNQCRLSELDSGHPKKGHADRPATQNLWRLLDPLINQLTHFAGIAPEQRGSFVDAVHAAILAHREASLGPLPERRYLPHRDSIVAFLREAWLPWIRAGILTRPILREIDPAAYTALNNYLKTRTLPPELYVPTKSEALARASETQIDALRSAARQVQAAEARQRRAVQRQKALTS